MATMVTIRYNERSRHRSFFTRPLYSPQRPIRILRFKKSKYSDWNAYIEEPRRGAQMSAQAPCVPTYREVIIFLSNFSAGNCCRKFPPCTGAFACRPSAARMTCRPHSSRPPASFAESECTSETIRVRRNGRRERRRRSSVGRKSSRSPSRFVSSSSHKHRSPSWTWVMNRVFFVVRRPSDVPGNDDRWRIYFFEKQSTQNGPSAFYSGCRTSWRNRFRSKGTTILCSRPRPGVGSGVWTGYGVWTRSS